MAGVCVQSAQSVSRMYNSSRQSELRPLQAPPTPNLWRHDPMLPLKCLIDAKVNSSSSPTVSKSVGSVPLPKDEPPKRKGRKKLLKKRKSLSSLSCSMLNGSTSRSPDLVPPPSKTPEPRYSHRLQSVPASSRIDELSIPAMRNTGVLATIVPQPNERRKKLPLLSI